MAVFYRPLTGESERIFRQSRSIARLGEFSAVREGLGGPSGAKVSICSPGTSLGHTLERSQNWKSIPIRILAAAGIGGDFVPGEPPPGLPSEGLELN